MTRRALGLAVALSLASSAALAGEAPPEDETPDALLASAASLIAADRPSDAIAKLESLGDHGVVDPVASYDRGLAYALRVRAGAEQPGDLGRAAHGFEEARELSHDAALVADATQGLAAVRAEVAKRRARAGDPVQVDHGVPLGRSIVDLLPENAWAAIALAASVVLAIGIVLRARARTPRLRVAGSTTCGIAASILVVAAVLAWAARDARLHLREGVVIAPNARLLDARHLARDGVAALAEGARVRILDEDGGFSHVVVGNDEGWLPSSTVLPIAKR